MFVLNDGPATTGTLRLVVDNAVIHVARLAVGARDFARTAIDLKRELPASVARRAAKLQFVRDGETKPCSEYEVYLSPFPS